MNISIRESHLFLLQPIKYYYMVWLGPSVGSEREDFSLFSQNDAVLLPSIFAYTHSLIHVYRKMYRKTKTENFNSIHFHLNTPVIKCTSKYALSHIILLPFAMNRSRFSSSSRANFILLFYSKQPNQTKPPRKTKFSTFSSS